MFLHDRKKPASVKLATIEDSAESFDAVLPRGETLWSPRYTPVARPMQPGSLEPLKLSDFDDPPTAPRRRIGA